MAASGASVPLWHHGSALWHQEPVLPCLSTAGFRVLAPPGRWRRPCLGVSGEEAAALAPRGRKKATISPSSPQHSASKWGLVETYEDERAGRQLVVDYLRDEGIGGRDVESLDLPSSVEVMRERLDFLQKLGLENAHILRYPQVLCCSVKRNMVPIIDYLEKLGFTAEALPPFLRKFPMVLHSSIVVDLQPVVAYLLGYGIAAENIALVLQRYPDILGFKLEGTISTSVAYLVSIGVNTRQIGPMLTQYPEILGMRVGNNIKRKVDFFCSLGFTKEEMAALLEKHPYVLGFDLNETVRPKVACLLKAGIKEKELPMLISRFPDVFEVELEMKLPEKAAWLTGKLCVQPAAVPTVIQKLPQIIVINEQKATERVEFLKEAGFSDGDVGKMVVKCPQILAIRLEKTMKPNLVFFQQQMRRHLRELVEFPIYLTYSLDGRIQPRYKRIKEKNIDCSLAWFLECSDEKFERRLSVEYIEAPDEDMKISDDSASDDGTADELTDEEEETEDDEDEQEDDEDSEDGLEESDEEEVDEETDEEKRKQ